MPIPRTHELRFRVRILFLALVALLSLTSCDKEEAAPPAGRVNVEYWDIWTGFEADAMRAVVDDFNASQDRIHVNYSSISQLDRKLMLATAGGVPPDLAGIYSQLIPVYAENNALMPLDQYAAKAGLKDADYIPAYWQMCMHRGHLWALRTTPSSTALIYNKKLFREAGLDPERPPQSIAELEQYNEKLTKHRPDGSIENLGHSPEEPGWWDGLWGCWFGARMWDGDHKITADSPENLAAYQWVESYPKRFGGDNVMRFTGGLGNFASPANAFFTGRVAMVMQGVWIYNFIKNYAPPGFEWGVAPFPSVDPVRLKDVTLAEANVLLVPAGSKHPAEAFEFIKYVESQKPMEKLCLGQLKFSPLEKCSDEFFAKHPHPYIREFLALAKSPNARIVPRVTTWTEYANDMHVAATNIFGGEVTAQDALEDVESRQQAAFDRHERRWDRIAAQLLAQWSKP